MTAAGLMAGIFLFAAPIPARDAREVGDWLCGRVFSGGGATLAFTCDGFFGLSLEPGKRPRQDMTGLWRLSGDGIRLTLFNRQDGEIHMAVGANALHGSLGDAVHVSLQPAPFKSATFRATGLVERTGGRETFIDAASGRSFPLRAPEAMADRFATIEIKIGPSGAIAGKTLEHSGKVPRFFRRPEPAANAADRFAKAVAGRYWLLPPLPGAAKAALRLSPPEAERTGGQGGAFEISGPGLRFEGRYSLENDKLTLKGASDSLRNIKIMGAGSLLEAFGGVMTWHVSPRGLELAGRRRLLLLPGGM